MKLTFNIWRQKSRTTPGRMMRYESANMNPDMSMLEALDVLNEELMLRGEEPVVFEHDCREGICGSCGFVINGVAHGPLEKTTVCQLTLRHFKDGEELYLEPWRAKAFPVLRDLMVDRSPFDRIIAAGGYVSVPSGSPQDANAILIPKEDSDRAMDAAACIGCGACVAACPNASASLFTGAKISHLGLLPQGQPERDSRAKRMVEQMTLESFGQCTNVGECEAVCPKGISLEVISRMNRDFMGASWRYRGASANSDGG
jgi:succinate dehydrogenase / fumarate reductase iron-sulfur subunit